jgi:hypothetical protein
MSLTKGEPVSLNWNAELVEQLDLHWTTQLRPRLEGLTDDEYYWEPVDGCWTVRLGDDGRHRPDWVYPPPDPPPVTTIAWRLCHIAGPVLGMRVSNHFGDGTWDVELVDWPGTADDALALLDDTYDAWRGGIADLGDEGLAKAVGPAEGPFAERSYAALILHIHREVIHHGAEVALLRDLYRAGAGQSTARWSVLSGRTDKDLENE